jgi:hypothetical protein
MKCVEDNIMAGGILLAFGKGILQWARGAGAGANAADILVDRIFTCIESKVLKQTNRRTKRADHRYNKRPSRGHGYGRGKPKPVPVPAP